LYTYRALIHHDRPTESSRRYASIYELERIKEI
jgi:hypothetical protein